MRKKLFFICVFIFVFVVGRIYIFAAGSREGLSSGYTIQDFKEYWKGGINDSKEGIYIQYNGNNPYLLAVYSPPNPERNYYVGLYLYGPGFGSGWQEGDTKAIFFRQINEREFNVLWFSRSGSDNEKVNIVFDDDDSVFRLTIPGFFGRTDYYTKIFPYAHKFAREKGVTGTGFLLNNEGYVITNFHVIEDKRHILVRGINKDFKKAYPYTAVLTDEENDIAILKPEVSFLKPGNPSYRFIIEEASVGSSVFALGYPMRSSMGNEIKLTNGIVSAQSGFRGNINEYQTTTAINPGNSGGPLFDEKGDIIGITSSSHIKADSVHYVVKIKYVFDLIKQSDIKINIPNNHFKLIWRSELTEIVKEVKDFVYMIEAF